MEAKPGRGNGFANGKAQEWLAAWLNHRLFRPGCLRPAMGSENSVAGQDLEHESVRNTAGSESSVVVTPLEKIGVMICADPGVEERS